MKNKVLLSAIILFSFAAIISCAEKEERKVEEVRPKPGISEIIRNPLSATGMEDTVNVARIAFEETRIDFDTVPEGQIVEHSFKFTNTGRIPLLISDARASCGCTVPEWPKNAIDPGKSGEITVRFNTEGRHHWQDRPINVIANTFPKTTTILLQGYVTPSKK